MTTGRPQRAMIALALIAFGAALLRVVLWSGMILYDDVHYVVRARELSLGGFTPPESVLGARLGVVGPAALLLGAFGTNLVTIGLYPFVCSMLGVGAAYFLGARLLSPQAGLVGAALVAFFPLDVLYSTVLFATAPQIFFVGVSVGAFLLAERASRPALMFASGLALGLGALVHETSLVALVFYPLYSIFVAPPSRRHALAGLGLLLAVALDPLVHGLMGDAGAHLRILLGGPVLAGTAPEAAGHGANPRWILEPFARLVTEQELGLFPALVAPVAIWRAFRPRSETQRALALFVLSVSLWLLYGTLSPARYAPLSRLPRFLAPVVLPAVWLLGEELAAQSRRLRTIALAALVATSLLCVAGDGGRARMTPYLELRRALARLGAERVVVERGHRFPLLVAEGFGPRYALATLEETPDPHRALVVAEGEAARARAVALPGAELALTIAAPETFYTRLLGTGPVMALLRATRPERRTMDLERKARPWALVVYRVP